MREFNYVYKKGLSIGLRSSSKNKRGSQALVLSTGMVPSEETLVALDTQNRLDISTISPAPRFPYPQIFEFAQVTILATATQIFEVASNGTLTQKLVGLTEGHVWSAADFHNFIVMVNGKQAIYRDGQSLVWSADDPYGMASASGVCNFNGQAILTAPNVVIP